MHVLEKMFPSLTLFSDLNWEAVTQEYESEYIDLSFPEYLQQKTEDGDCPPYLFELAFYEMALNELKTVQDPYPHQPGIYLNPTALFLSLEFDIKEMLALAQKGEIEIIERPHVLSLYKDTHDEIHSHEVTEEELNLLQLLEDGPQPHADFVSKADQKHFENLISKGLILQI